MNKWLILAVLGSALPQAVQPLQAAPVSAVTLRWPTLKPETPKNETGFNADYAALQYLLKARGFYSAKIDGVYGSKTIQAVKSFQRSRKFKVDGIAGPQTLKSLVMKVKRGSKGNAVRAVQILVRNHPGINGGTPNLGISTDGVFGAATEKAVRISQESFNLDTQRLAVDGVVGERTWCLLLGGQTL